MDTQALTRLHRLASSSEPKQKDNAINPKISYNHIEYVQNKPQSQIKDQQIQLLVTHLQWDLQILDRWSLSIERHFEFRSTFNLKIGKDCGI